MLNFIKRVFGLSAAQTPVEPVAPYKVEEPVVVVEAKVETIAAPAAMKVAKKPRKAKAKPAK